MWAVRGDRVRASILTKEIARSIAEEGLNVMNIKMIKHALSHYWISRLKNTATLDEQSVWVQLLKEIVMHDYPKTTKEKLTVPWKQVWDARSHQLPSSTSHFWSYWFSIHRDNRIPPATRKQLNGILFWYHPQLSQGRASPSWGAAMAKISWWFHTLTHLFLPSSLCRCFASKEKLEGLTTTNNLTIKKIEPLSRVLLHIIIYQAHKLVLSGNNHNGREQCPPGKTITEFFLYIEPRCKSPYRENNSSYSIAMAKAEKSRSGQI